MCSLLERYKRFGISYFLRILDRAEGHQVHLKCCYMSDELYDVTCLKTMIFNCDFVCFDKCSRVPENYFGFVRSYI
jgi:hypothetical protein